jgi:hypothetical protein
MKYFIEICEIIIKICGFADWHTYEICECAIADCASEFADLGFADFKKVCLLTSDIIF